MIQEPTPVANSRSEAELERRHQAMAGWAAFRDPRVWGAYLAQTLGFVLLFFVFFPTAQPRLLLILGYVALTLTITRKLHMKVQAERLSASNANSGSA